MELSLSFDKLSLHDALLCRIEIDWENAWVILDLQAFVDISEPASPHHLLFRGVADFRCTRTNEWGPSSAILDVSMVNGEYKIQMQSGDSILIKASGYEFKKGSL